MAHAVQNESIIRDAKNNNRAALKILGEHYIVCSKLRIISMYWQLTSLKLASTETVTDYLSRAKVNVARLKEVKETLSDSRRVRVERPPRHI